MSTTALRVPINKYLGFSPKDAKRDRSKGRSDGSHNVPDPDASNLSPYELEVIAESQAAVSKYKANMNQQLARLEAEAQAKRSEVSERIYEKRDTIDADTQARAGALNQAIGPDSPSQRMLSAELRERRDALKRVEIEVNRPLRVNFVGFWYMLILIGLAVAEVPVNRLAFQFFFQESPIIALVLALLVGGIFMFMAHIAGTVSRQLVHYRGAGGKLMGVLTVLGVVGLVGVAIALIAAIRQLFVDFLQQEQSANLSDLIKGDLGSIATRAIKTELGEAGWTLLILNVLIFVAGALLAFFRHDPHPDYEGLSRKTAKLDRRLRKLQRKHQKRLDAMLRESNKKIDYLNKLADVHSQELAELDKEIARTRAQMETDIAVVVDVTKHRILAYQSGNSDMRKTKSPAYFGKPETLDIKQLVLRPAD
ncbi:MAG: hypothetical protein KIT16_06210 [Rhodospirillaceae bacterium]|nr:hypothetical protein [Rhodospirillaceae bacterium]